MVVLIYLIASGVLVLVPRNGMLSIALSISYCVEYVFNWNIDWTLSANIVTPTLTLLDPMV